MTSTGDVRFVAARLSEAATIVGIDRRSFAAPWSDLSIASEIDSAGGRAWLAIAEDQEPVGYAIYRLLGAGEAELLRVAVIPEARRRDIGRLLLAHSLTQLEHEGTTIVHLEVAADNLAAQRLYERLSFRRVGRRAGYYSDGQDAELWRRGPDGGT